MNKIKLEDIIYELQKLSKIKFQHRWISKYRVEIYINYIPKESYLSFSLGRKIKERLWKVYGVLLQSECAKKERILKWGWKIHKFHPLKEIPKNFHSGWIAKNGDIYSCEDYRLSHLLFTTKFGIPEWQLEDWGWIKYSCEEYFIWKEKRHGPGNNILTHEQKKILKDYFKLHGKIKFIGKIYDKESQLDWLT